MSHEFALETQPSLPVLYVRTRCPVQALGQVAGECWGQIGAYLAELGAAPTSGPYMAYYNADMNDLDVEMGFPVTGPLPDRGNLQFRALPECRVATCLHVGSYSQIGATYSALQAWMSEQGLNCSSQMYEWYLNDPDQVAPEELLTRIAWVLA